MTKIVNKAKEIKAMQIWGRLGFPIELGDYYFGKIELGCQNTMHAIYQRRHSPTGVIIVKEKFYASHAPDSAAQLACRDNMRQATAAWQALSDSQKEGWRHFARGKRMTGFNLYIKKYMLDLL